MIATKPHNHKLELADFPKDVQRLLRKRALKNCRPIEREIEDFTSETSDRVLANKEGAA